MSDLNNKISYLKGLADGLKLEKETKEGQMLLAIIDVLDEMALEVEELYEIMSELDEDLNEVEDELYGTDDNFDPNDVFEVNCPNCDASVMIDDAMLENEKIVCPSCNEEIEFEFDCNCDDCDDCC